MKTITHILFCLLVILTACNADKTEHKNKVYNPISDIKEVKAEISFWENKIAKAGENSLYNAKLASAYTQDFSLTAHIKSLRKAEQLLNQNLVDHPDNCNTLRSLAQNYVSQHRFIEAKDILLKAQEVGTELRYTHLLMYDVYAELAENDLAKSILDDLAVKQDFNYLIRAAKWQDQAGHLDNAISLLEKAREKAERSKNSSQLNWIYSNLGDFYGHAGRLDDSKTSFLKALEMNPSDWYSYKGLAYMKWSADGEAREAINMLLELYEGNKDPSIALLIADMQDHIGNTETAEQLRAEAYKKVSQSDYGNMYNSFRCKFSIGNNNIDKAESIAHDEMKVRQTPSSFALLAVAKYHQNKEQEALDIALDNVIGKTFEPKVLLDILPVAQLNDSLKQAILVEVEEASYELGPLAFHKLEDY